MQFVKPAIATISVGIAMSLGALLLAAGARRQTDGAPEREDPGGAAMSLDDHRPRQRRGGRNPAEGLM